VFLASKDGRSIEKIPRVLGKEITSFLLKVTSLSQQNILTKTEKEEKTTYRHLFLCTCGVTKIYCEKVEMKFRCDSKMHNNILFQTFFT
jgi:hypothetical protein